ncbi:CoA-binding protein [Patulibacter sp.]|uniref:CoA-binding protein n=1 Tax=Patulibacter sp. TaxID=1912859 RepID=UPI0027243B2D|nr:CoA-binding protein [Patulibacter sp.]MDO9409451.1 CoA-binding protein [Patulibacter sp.]
MSTIDGVDDGTVRELLATPRVWAVVGCSPRPDRDSHRIAALLRSRGNTIVPIHPQAEEILGERAYPTLAAAREDHAIDVVDVFRRSEEAGVHVDEAAQIGASAAWLQLGVIDVAAAERGRAAGLTVVMNRCPAIEYPRLAL